MYEENIEWMLNQENHEKKRTGSGIHHRASRTRKHEVVRTPSEFLTGFEKRKTTSPGVVITNTIGGIKLMALVERINEGDIPLRQEFFDIDFGNGQKAAAELRRLHTNTELMKAWGCTSNTVSNFFSKLQIAKTKGRNVLIGQAAIDHLQRIHNARGIMPKEIIQVQVPSEPEKEVGILVNVNKKFKTEEVIGFLERLCLFLNGPEQELQIELRIKEL